MRSKSRKRVPSSGSLPRETAEIAKPAQLPFLYMSTQDSVIESIPVSRPSRLIGQFRSVVGDLCINNVIQSRAVGCRLRFIGHLESDSRENDDWTIRRRRSGKTEESSVRNTFGDPRTQIQEVNATLASARTRVVS